VCRRGRDEQYRSTAHLKPIDTRLEWDVLVLLAIAVIFAIVERCERKAGTPAGERTHPSAAARMLYSME
jgi:hypothetical protein